MRYIFTFPKKRKAHHGTQWDRWRQRKRTRTIGVCHICSLRDPRRSVYSRRRCTCTCTCTSKVDCNFQFGSDIIEKRQFPKAGTPCRATRVRIPYPTASGTLNSECWTPKFRVKLASKVWQFTWSYRRKAISAANELIGAPIGLPAASPGLGTGGATGSESTVTVRDCRLYVHQYYGKAWLLILVFHDTMHYVVWLIPAVVTADLSVIFSTVIKANKEKDSWPGTSTNRSRSNDSFWTLKVHRRHQYHHHHQLEDAEKLPLLLYSPIEVVLRNIRLSFRTRKISWGGRESQRAQANLNVVMMFIMS